MYIVTQRSNPRSDKNAAFAIPGIELLSDMVMTSYMAGLPLVQSLSSR